MDPKKNPEQKSEANYIETEKIKTPESPRTIEELRNEAEKIKAAITEDYNSERAAIAGLEKSLAQKTLVKESLDNPEARNVLRKSQELETEAKQEVEESKAKIDAVINTNPDEIPSAEKIKLNTTYKEINQATATERLKKIEPDMQHALSNCGQVFKDCQYPWTMIGSNALVLEADTEKKGDDLDIIFADKDFDKVYENFQKLAAAGRVKDLKLTEMLNFKNEKKWLPKNFRLYGCWRRQQSNRV